MKVTERSYPCEDWITAHYADGPTVAAWLIAHDLDRSSDNLGRNVRRWRSGRRRVSIETLDRYLTPLGIHLSELPAEAWRRDALVDRLLAGASISAISREFDVHHGTVTYHRRYCTA